MRFGRVTGVVVDRGQDLELIVTLETSGQIREIRREIVPGLKSKSGQDDLTWSADQYTQETIGNHLALEGWEAVGHSADAAVRAGETAPSVSYVVRQV